MALPGDRYFRFWVLIEAAEDVPDTWTAHCLDVDVVTVGRSVLHAMEMVAEAVSTVVIDEVTHGREPAARRAPEAFWERFNLLMGRAVPMSTAEIGMLKPGSAAIVELDVRVWVVSSSEPARPVGPGLRRATAKTPFVFSSRAALG